ncbi:MAG: hypothetical protein H6737_00505 [Alphaproteobacteria bacterium]|nr:hypothetical protein [Alphaproteobacteria bacterium]
MRPILLALPLLGGCIYTVVVETETFEVDEPFSSVVVTNPTGDLTVLGRTGIASLDVTKRYHGNEPELRLFVEDDTLFVEGSCPRPQFTCSIDLVLSVPADADVTAHLETGGVDLRDLDGAFDIDTSTGSLALHQLGGTAEARTSTGSIVGTDLELTDLVARTSTGSIDLVHAWRATSIDAETSTGSVDLLVPGGRYDVDVAAGTGSVEVVGLVDDPTADASVRAHTGTGSVRVVGYSPPVETYLPVCTAADGDPYTVTGASIAGDTLSVDVEYGGGCAMHDWTLCWPDATFAESNPVQVTLDLLHDDHDDACDAVVLDTIELDLAPLRQAWRDAYAQTSGTITVHLGGSTATYSF